MNESHNLTVLEWAATMVIEVFRWLGNIKTSFVFLMMVLLSIPPSPSEV